MMKLKQQLWAKIVAFVLLILFLLVTVCCGFGTLYSLESQFFLKDEETVREAFLDSMSWKFSDMIQQHIFIKGSASSLLVNGWGTEAEDHFDYVVSDYETGEVLVASSTPSNTHYRHVAEREYTIHQEVYTDEGEYDVDASVERGVLIKIMVKSFPKNSRSSIFEWMYMNLYRNRFSVIVYTLASAIVSVLLAAFLIGAVGHKKGKDGVQGGLLQMAPLDLLTVFGLFAVVLCCLCMEWVINEYVDPWIWSFSGVAVIFGFALLAILGFVVGAVIMGWLLCLALQIKTKTLLKSSLIYRVLALVGRLAKRPLQLLMMLIRNLPLMWKTTFALCLLSIAEILGIFLFGSGELVLLWFIEKLILVPAILLLVINLRKLQAGGNQLATGDLNSKIDTTFMYWDFKKHAENLNSIGEGMNKAVDERMKSERFKTELITNVSHDIKTPLTSIINYVDLLKKQEPEGEKVQEYLSILERQSARLKKLIEDLVEASKASSGSVSVELKPCLIDIVLTQAAGEYEEKLQTSGLELIVKKPQEPIQVYADGRHLWRVFDNLMNNICKHALPGSRVYLTLEREGNEAVITLKNISKYELDISSDELMERFVRGDKSRNTEGNGLGLSIARSLTELQKGSFSLQIDGDLFKAILRFRIV